MAGFNPQTFYDSSFQYTNNGLYNGFNYPGPNDSDWEILLAVDLAANGIGDWFTLDDPVKGLLDNATYLLAGEVLVDITRWVRNLSVSRGRSRRIGTFTAGSCSFVLDNRDRIFDPLMIGSPFYGSIVPRKEVRVFYKKQTVFIGNVQDWDYSYNVNGDSVAIPSSIDALAYLSRLKYPARTEIAEYATARVGRVLDAVGWPAAGRIISVLPFADAYLHTDVHGDVSALTYLQSIELSDLGALFVNKNGLVEYRSRRVWDDSSQATFGIGGIPFSNIEVTYETDAMTNLVSVGYDASSTNVYTDTPSQDAYGELSTSFSTLLADTSEADMFGDSYIASFKDPNYYIQSVSVNILGVGTTFVSTLLSLELRDTVEVIFRPNDTGVPQIYELVIDQIEHQVSPGRHVMKFAMSPPFIFVPDEVGI